MPASRLSDSDRSELVARYQAGATTAELSQTYEISTNTVSRLLKATIDPREYEQLKRQRLKKSTPPAAVSANPVATSAIAPSSEAPLEAINLLDDDATEISAGKDSSALAINDAADFSSIDESSTDEDVYQTSADSENDSNFMAVPISLVSEESSHHPPKPLAEAAMSGAAYILVDKSVEIQRTLLSDFPEFGHLPSSEKERYTLVVFANPRHAKRQCGRSQRVIKLPDADLLKRTAPYLLAQGISRLLIEGCLYAVPGS